MKKILLFIAIIMTLALNASAQTDGFFSADVPSGHRDAVMMPNAPSGELGKIKDTDAAPLGSGLLIMTVLGCSMVIRKKLKD